ncbi:hypothetical protein QTG56_24765 (plasmid) [Rossellomorea sp. AcN35-11]|nr:hypothetical protein [Rossellomorea aquimaris]WJV31848.1 hypothetical protein QTG56_24765 [Rossellomorea sp. AcN35-11]
MKRIAFVTESKNRPEKPMPAYQFYAGPNNRWVKGIVDYMEAREFPHEHIYFLSLVKEEVIHYEQEISSEDYEAVEYYSSKKKSKLTQQIKQLLKSYTDEHNGQIYVELHLSRSNYSFLTRILEDMDIPYHVEADGIPLGPKQTHYKQLIQEELDRKRIREIQREKWSLTSLIKEKTPQEAKHILDTFAPKAKLFGVEDLFQELRDNLKKHYQADRDMRKAREEADELAIKEDTTGELEDFFRNQYSISNLFEDIDQYENLKSKYGKAIAKLQRALIKREYESQNRHKLQGTLLKIQIALLK